MSIINNGLLLASGADAAVGYQISRSLRFNGSVDSTSLTRTPASAGNRRTFTWSGWVKRSALSAKRQELFRCNTAPLTQFGFAESAQGNAEALIIYSDGGAYLVTTPVFRDVSSWYHLTVVFDTTNATSSDRVRLFVNGTRVSTFNTATYPSQNFDTSINTTNLHYIGASGNANEYFDGYLADIHFIDGQALAPSDFAETNATTGQWIPKAYTGSYGTNGFRLTFSDNSGTTSTTLGKDAAGSNNWTPNNFSVASGSGNDSLVDSPSSYGTDTGAGGEVRGNYATLNPLSSTNAGNLADGNLQQSGLTNSHATIRLPSSGKWYFEVTPTQKTAGYVIGLQGVGMAANPSTSNVIGIDEGGNRYNGNGTSTSGFLSAINVNDVLGVAVDRDGGTVNFYRNGTAGASSLSTSVLGSDLVPFGHTNAATVQFNFGQRAFAYTAPSGFKALCDTNLTSPTIAKPNTVMDVKLYTGNGSSQTISGLGFSPDFVWIKTRSASGYAHILQDTIRGAGKILATQNTNAEVGNAGNLIGSFNSDGFSVNTTYLGGTAPETNGNGDTFVAWAWDAGTSTVTNNNGSISSQVRANASPGFSVITYTGNGATNATVGHGCGTAPQLVIGKWRGGSSDWEVYHKAAGATKVLQLNNTNAAGTLGHFGSTDPTSTLITVNASGTGNEINGNGQSYVLYAFAPVAGYSAFGSYTGNGSTDGPFVFCNFRPRWILIKVTSQAGDQWVIHDSVRDTYNVANKYLLANSSGAEATSNGLDILSNGFKVRDTSGSYNTNGATYVYFAVAENPFQYARAR